MRIRQAAEENPIHYAENRRCRANSHRKCDNYRDGKDRTAPECSQCVPDVLSKSFEEGYATRIPALFFDLIESSEFKTKAPGSFLVG